MAYKFQIGEAKLSGSITQTSGTITALGFSNSDANITNVGDINCDSISVVQDSVGLDIDGSGANTGLFTLTMGDNLDSALEITEGSNSYLKFTTTNSSELIESYQNLRMSGSKAVQFGNADTKIGGNNGSMQIEVSGASNSMVFVHGATSNFAVKNALNESEVNLRMSGSTKVQFGSADDHIGINAGNIEISGGAYVDIANHDGTAAGLALGGTLVSASAAELNLLDAFGDDNYDKDTHNIVFHNGTSLKRESNADFLGAISKNGLEVNSGQLQIRVDGGTLTQAASGLKVADGGIGNTQLTGNISASKLNLDSDNFTNNAGELQINLATVSGLEIQAGEGLRVDLSSSNALELSSGGLDLKTTIAGNRTFSGDTITFNGTASIDGDLIVLGSTFSASVGELLIQDNNITLRDGAAPADNTGFTFGTSGTTHTLQISDSVTRLSSSLALLAPELHVNGWAITQTQISGNLPVSASAFYGDGSNLSGISADSANGFKFNTYNTASAAQSLNGTAGYYTVNSTNGQSSNAVTLDLSGSWTNGNVVMIKAPINAATNNLTVRAAGANTIDGDPSIVLESNGAAVTLVYGGGNWGII